MRAMTTENLRSAFGGESMAHMRYLVWAEKAEKEGFPNVARLFRAISRAEQAHASGHFRAMRSESGAFPVFAGGGFGLTDTAENLARAIEGELHEVEEMYPAYLAAARMQDEKGAVCSMEYALQAEQIHAKMFADAKTAVEGGKDAQLETVYICPVCGHTHEGDGLSDCCPICNVKRDLFVEFAA